MTKNVTEHVEPKKVIQALIDPSWIEAMQDELLQFKLQKVWTLVDLPYGKRAIGIKWVCRNKKDDRGIVVRNKARLVAQGYTQEEGIDYDENREPLSEDILGATTQRDTGSYYPKRYWELLPKEILGATTQRDIERYYPKRYWDVLWENGGCILYTKEGFHVVVVVFIGVVIVVKIIGVVVVVGGVSSILKLSFAIIGDPVGLFYPNRLGICIPPGQGVIGSSGTGSLPSGRVDLTGDEDPTDEDGDTRMGDSTRVSVSLGGKISLEGKKSQEKLLVVIQPPGFEDPQFPDKVYKVEKALYGLHQAPRAWCETLSTYLLENGFRRGTIDKTLFIKKDKGDILLVKVYVDDIIFGSTKKSLCVEFEQMMHKRFLMSSMGDLTFFLGLQVKQKDDGIFISQDKYVADILKKFDFATVKTASTPIETNKALLKNEEAEDVDVHSYRLMIGSLMYLTASRPDIMFVVCACARFQVTPKVSHLHAVKRIFRYLKGQPKLCLWYPRDSPFNLEAFSDSDYAGANLDRKSTIGGCQFIGKRLISWQCKKQTIVANSTTEAENPVFHSKTKHIEIRHHFIRDSYEKKLIHVIKIHTDHNVTDLLTKAFDVSRLDERECINKTIYKELEDIMGRATTTSSNLEAEQDSGNINRTQSMPTLNESLP
ncbi:putative ribonuclease H-like domain-containing protein [Tanacetum coccineum]